MSFSKKASDFSPAAPPKDHYYAVYLIFFFGGLAMLLPWNALITADDYFRRKFQNTNYENNFQNYISLCFTFVNFIALAVAIKYQGRFTTLKTEIFGSLALNIAAFVFLTATAQFSIGTAETYFYVTMFIVVVCAIGTSYMQNGLFGISAQFPPIYILAVMSGQGMAGLVVAISSIVTNGINVAGGTAVTDEAAKWSGFYYFLFGTLVLVISAGSFVLLETNTFYIYYTKTVQNEFVPTSSGSKETSISDITAEESQPLTAPKKSMLQISWQIRSYAFSCFLTFVVTLAAFPPLTSSVIPIDINASELYKALFVPAHFLLFNIGDWIGRVMPSLRPFHIVNSKAISVGTWLRVLFILGFAFCNVNGKKESPLPDWAFFALVIFFSITNGWLGSLTMMAGPAAVDPVDSSAAGMLMSFYMTFGLTAGAMLSFLIRWFVCQCNPFME